MIILEILKRRVRIVGRKFFIIFVWKTEPQKTIIFYKISVGGAVFDDELVGDCYFCYMFFEMFLDVFDGERERERERACGTDMRQVDAQ